MAEKKVVEKWDGIERRNKKPKPKQISTGPDIYLGGDGIEVGSSTVDGPVEKAIKNPYPVHLILLFIIPNFKIFFF
mgnify:CR=1 FL=1